MLSWGEDLDFKDYLSLQEATFQKFEEKLILIINKNLFIFALSLYIFLPKLK